MWHRAKRITNPTRTTQPPLSNEIHVMEEINAVLALQANGVKSFDLPAKQEIKTLSSNFCSSTIYMSLLLAPEDSKATQNQLSNRFITKKYPKLTISKTLSNRRR